MIRTKLAPFALSLLLGCALEPATEQDLLDVELEQTEQELSLVSLDLSEWVQTPTITDPQAVVGSRSGRSVAAYGNRVATASQTVTYANSGRARVLRYSNNSWIEELSTPTPSGRYQVVELGANLYFVGEPCGSSSCLTGRVRIYRHDGIRWLSIQSISAPSVNWNYGRALAFDGTRLAVHGGAFVYIYRYNGSSFVLDQSLMATPTGYASDSFGYDVSIAGNYLAISAPAGTRWVGGAIVNSPGYVHVYELSGNTFNRVTTLTGVGLEHNNNGGGTGFGASVSLSGQRLAVSAEFESGKQSTAYLFTRSSTGTWALTNTVDLPDSFYGAAHVALTTGTLLTTSGTALNSGTGLARFYTVDRFGLRLNREHALPSSWAPASIAGARAAVGQPSDASQAGTTSTFYRRDPILTDTLLAP